MQSILGQKLKAVSFVCDRISREVVLEFETGRSSHNFPNLRIEDLGQIAAVAVSLCRNIDATVSLYECSPSGVVTIAFETGSVHRFGNAEEIGDESDFLNK